MSTLSPEFLAVASAAVGGLVMRLASNATIKLLSARFEKLTRAVRQLRLYGVELGGTNSELDRAEAGEREGGEHE